MRVRFWIMAQIGNSSKVRDAKGALIMQLQWEWMRVCFLRLSGRIKECWESLELPSFGVRLCSEMQHRFDIPPLTLICNRNACNSLFIAYETNFWSQHTLIIDKTRFVSRKIETIPIASRFPSFEVPFPLIYRRQFRQTTSYAWWQENMLRNNKTQSSCIAVNMNPICRNKNSGTQREKLR